MVERYREYHSILRVYLAELESQPQNKRLEETEHIDRAPDSSRESKMRQAFLEVLKEEFG